MESPEAEFTPRVLPQFPGTLMKVWKAYKIFNVINWNYKAHAGKFESIYSTSGKYCPD